jgi:Ca-activated chloride channel family protein
VNRTLTQWAARAGNGVEVICGLSEDPERVAARLLSRTCLPLVTDLVIEGEGVVALAPARLPDLYAGAPCLIALELGTGAITVRGRTAEGPFEERVEVPAIALGEGLASVAALFARERVEDLETERAARGEDGRIDRDIEQLGLTFRIATRLTSWIAVSDAVTVDPDAEKRAVRQPHEVPEGVSIAGMGLRPAQPTAGAGGVMLGAPAMPSAPAPSAPMPQRARYGMPSASVSLPDALGQPKRRSSKGPWIVAVLLVLLVLAVIGAWLTLSLSTPTDAPRESTTEAPQRE